MKKKPLRIAQNTPIPPTWESAGWLWLAIDFTFPEPGENNKVDVGVYRCPMGKMHELLGPLGALRIIGSSDELRGKIKDAEKLFREIKTIKLFNDADWQKSVNALDELLDKLRYFYRRSLEAEAILKDNELHLDPDTGKVKFLSSKREFLNVIISTVYSDSFGDHGEPKSMVDFRQLIKEVLADFFLESELDAGPHGNIAHAIENYRR